MIVDTKYYGKFNTVSQELENNDLSTEYQDFAFLGDKIPKDLKDFIVNERMIKEAILLKEEKLHRLNSIIVTTTNNNTFDGNESARNNMISAIIAEESLNNAEYIWKLADNTLKVISLTELKEALALSIQEVGNIVRSYK